MPEVEEDICIICQSTMFWDKKSKSFRCPFCDVDEWDAPSKF